MPHTSVSPEPRPRYWKSKQRHVLDAMPLGIARALAQTHVTLTVPSTILTPGADADSQPSHPISMSDLRLKVMRQSRSQKLKDHVWRTLAETARTDGGDWNLFLIGMASPGLIHKALPWSKRLLYPYAVQFQYRVLEEFLFAAHRLELDAPYVVNRFIGAAYDQATERKKSDEPPFVPIQSLDETQLPFVVPSDLPDPRIVLADLMRRTRNNRAGHRFTLLHAELVALTYLDGCTLTELAEALKLQLPNASKQRDHALRMLAEYFSDFRRDSIRDTVAPNDAAPSEPGEEHAEVTESATDEDQAAEHPHR